MPDRRSDWLITCGCGWTRELSQRWAAESAAKQHPKLAAPGTEHTITIERPLEPAPPAARPAPGDATESNRGYLSSALALAGRLEACPGS